MAVKVNRNLTTVNYTHANNTSKVWTGQKRSIQWIVLHYTANGKSYKGMAYNNTSYFKSVYRGCSAHYFVDDAEIWQSVEDRDSSWHCGDAASKNGCYNWNSIGIEICDNNGEITPAAEALAVQLVKLKMKQYNIPITRVCRHYDVTGKKCPLSWANDETKWRAFLAKLTEPEEVKISMGEITSINGKGRGTNDLVLITDGRKTTGFNKWGCDVIINSKGIITQVVIEKANTPIPAGCICLSGHGTNEAHLAKNCKVGARLKVG